MSQILNNFGKEPRMLRPTDVDHIYRDPRDKTLPVLLISSPATTTKHDPKDDHWTVAWVVHSRDNIKALRRLHIVREINYNHLTNWGPITQCIRDQSLGRTHMTAIAYLDYPDRQRLEEIALANPVYVPNGLWNCQDWVEALMQKAIDAGVVTSAQWTMAMEQIALAAEQATA
ncbi:hypothetical protein C8F01DRAFT_1124893 [Mycena amicta]|nr:hypothetical protein C8F01DRAFT_1124893 [Mycena amicta]